MSAWAVLEQPAGRASRSYVLPIRETQNHMARSSEIPEKLGGDVETYAAIQMEDHGTFLLNLLPRFVIDYHMGEEVHIGDSSTNIHQHSGITRIIGILPMGAVLARRIIGCDYVQAVIILPGCRLTFLKG